MLGSSRNDGNSVQIHAWICFGYICLTQVLHDVPEIIGCQPWRKQEQRGINLKKVLGTYSSSDICNCNHYDIRLPNSQALITDTLFTRLDRVVSWRVLSESIVPDELLGRWPSILPPTTYTTVLRSRLRQPRPTPNMLNTI